MKNHVLHEKVVYKTFRDCVEDIGERYADRKAFLFRKKATDKEILSATYPQLRDDVRALTTELLSMGYKGKHICLVGKLSYEWALVYYSVLCANAVLVPLDKDWNKAELEETTKRADVEYLFYDSDLTDKCADLYEGAILVDGEGEGTVQGLIAKGRAKLQAGDRAYFENEINPDVLSLLVFTSGTTGKGKGVMLSQTNLLSDIAEALPFIDFTSTSIGVLPPHHTFGSSINILGHNSIGCELYISGGLRYIQKELKELKPGHLVLVPLYLETFYRRIWANIKDQKKEGLIKFMIKVSNLLRKIGIDLRRKLFKQILDVFGGNLRMVVSGGAGISQDILDFYDAIGVSVLNGYGITECAPIISVNHSVELIPGSVGPVLDCNEVVIKDVSETGEGEICVKGSNVMLGYYKDEAATKDAFDEEGYFKTGDYGKFGKGGALFITGRKKNLIILSNGKNVYPEEIETEFISVPGVIDIIVYEGQSKRGAMYNQIVAEIYPDKEFFEKNGIEDKEKYFNKFIVEYNKTATAYKKIGILKVRDEEFPKNTLRKIMRFKLDMSID